MRVLSIFILATLAVSSHASDLEPNATSYYSSVEPSANSDSDQRSVIRFTDTSAGWINTHIAVDAGETILLEAEGLWEIQGLRAQPRHVIWYRVGDEGTAYNLAANRFSFVSDNAGDLYVTVRPVGIYWDSPQGAYPVEFSALPGFDTGLSLRVTQDAQTVPVMQQPPRGFSYLANLGQSQVWSDQTVDGQYTVHGEPIDDTGIIKAELDIPISTDTVFSFEWNYQAMPAAMAETNIAGHDYFSVALEFANGQDLTWMRSEFLSAGEHFRCPLPWWDQRETHFVIEDAAVPSGSWQTHERNVLADYAEAVPGDLPKKIVGVWFIANNVFAKQPGKALFRNLKIQQGGEEIALIPVVTRKRSEL